MAALPNLAALLAAGSGPGDLATSAAGGNPLTPVADTGDATAAAVNGCRTTPTPPSAGLLVGLSSWWVGPPLGNPLRVVRSADNLFKVLEKRRWWSHLVLVESRILKYVGPMVDDAIVGAGQEMRVVR